MSNMTNVTPPALWTSPAQDEFEACGCPEVIDHYVVLFPYYWLLISLGFLALLNVLATLVWYRRCDNFGTLLMTSIWKPSLLFLIPQASLHLFHFTWLVGSIFDLFEVPRLPQLVGDDVSLTRWDKYQLLYALWVNSGVISFMVTGCICPSLSSFMLRIRDIKKKQLQQKTEQLKCPPKVAWNETGEMITVFDQEGQPIGTLSNGAVVNICGDHDKAMVPVGFCEGIGFVKTEYLVTKDKVTQKDLKQLHLLSEDLEIMGEKKPIMQELTSSILLVLLFPVIITHVIPGFVLYIWILGPLALLGKVLINFAVKPPKALNSKYSMWYRVFFVAFVAFLLAACFQASVNFALLTFTGVSYFEVAGKEFSLRQTGCVMCMIVKPEHAVSAFSFL
eukprot:TRINITY_DN3838_c0_g4_i1.p1 TRINITY_DN3838_c0_g4~~TRINITY_DN3838_c0_g4_i1.p1  ORF type:complete len:408 (+),score=51.32 TRINITY_DN3838_c0_g4_i1:54-1226(+)